MLSRPIPLAAELLESRDCPAVNFFNGILTVTGTSSADTLTVTQSGNTIVAGGQSFNAASVARIVITGLGGNDVIRNATSKPSTLYGGTGNDTVFGGSARDKIFGGQGADTLYGKAGKDKLFGGSGTDTLYGGAGTNVLVQEDQTVKWTSSAIELEIVRLVNVERAAAGLPPLTINQQLNAAAGLHTRDMVVIGNVYGPTTGMQHTLYGTTRPQVQDRLDAAGYDNWTTSFTYGENIAYGFTSAADVMNAWMNSTGHRANILSSSFSEIGVAVVADASGRLFFTQNFGYRA